MSLCVSCIPSGYCRQNQTVIVSDEELSNPQFVRDLRNFAHSLNVSSYHWHDFLCDLYRDYRGHIVDEYGNEVFLDLCVLEVPYIRDWFRDFCCTPVPANITPYVRGEARERARILATILRANYPQEAVT